MANEVRSPGVLGVCCRPSHSGSAGRSSTDGLRSKNGMALAAGAEGISEGKRSGAGRPLLEFGAEPLAAEADEEAGGCRAIDESCRRCCAIEESCRRCCSCEREDEGAKLVDV